MAKVTYTFDLNDPEDHYRTDIYRDAERIYDGVKLFSGRLRNTLKYGQGLTDDQRFIFEAVRSALNASMEEEGVQIDTFGDIGEPITWGEK